MMHLVVAPPGEGKTTLMTVLALEALGAIGKKKKSRRRVASNFPIIDPSTGEPDARVVRFDSFEEMIALDNCICFMDEASTWFGRRSWAKTDDNDLSFFRMHRKEGLTVYLAAHSVEDIDSKVVALCVLVWECQRLFGPDKMTEEPTPFEDAFGWWAIARMYNRQDYLAVTKRKFRGRKIYRIDQYIKYFDSFSRVGSRDGSGVQRGRRVDLSGPEPVSAVVKAPVSERLFRVCECFQTPCVCKVSAYRWTENAAVDDAIERVRGGYDVVAPERCIVEGF